METDTSIWMGTASGTLLSSLSFVRSEDVIITAILASLGAVVSFLMSCLLNLLLKPQIDKKRKLKKQPKISKGKSPK